MNFFNSDKKTKKEQLPLVPERIRRSLAGSEIEKKYQFKDRAKTILGCYDTSHKSNSDLTERESFSTELLQRIGYTTDNGAFFSCEVINIEKISELHNYSSKMK